MCLPNKFWKKQEELEKYKDASELAETDDEAEFDGSIVKKFFEKMGTKQWWRLPSINFANFNLNEFKAVYAQFSDHISLNYIIRRGRESPIKPKDLFFITLAILKHASK